MTKRNLTKRKLMKAIKSSEFTKNAFNNNYAFDITIDGVTYEVCPERWKYYNGIGLYNKSTGESSSL